MRLGQAVAIAAAAVTAVGLAIVAGPASAAAQGGPRTTEVAAAGNPFTGGLAFRPTAVQLRVGDAVRWRNTDFLVPHTSTEAHGLWDLAGSYGQTPFNPAGYGPRTTAERRFEAGLHSYYCRVHPQQMRGSVGVPVTLRRETVRLRRKRTRRSSRRRRKFRTIRYVVATWAASPPARGLVFDVERRIGSGGWQAVRTGTTDQSGRFRSRKPGAIWQVRARLRRAGNPAAATGWSPAATIGG